MEWWAGWTRTNTGSDSDKLDAGLNSVTEDHRPPPTPFTPDTERLALRPELTIEVNICCFLITSFNWILQNNTVEKLFFGSFVIETELTQF